VIGQQIGPYAILSKLGEGGMGEVYRAHDTKLNRDVALTILPESFSSDPDRLARFTREAQALAALNHPNIAHIHGLEESAGVRALVRELVDGEDLSDVIARGPIAVPEALATAAQMAQALEAAHEAGIIHRDLKPANIKLKADGTVKVLDFGLAKALTRGTPISGGRGAGGAEAQTLTSPAMTALGTIIGTAAYMAPEQAKGRAVDKRVDIWAFGVVFFEMLTGRPLFPGETVTDVLASVVTREPDWTALPVETPPAIRRLLRRCLEKDPNRRVRDAADARLEIEDAPLKVLDLTIPEAAAPTAAISPDGRWVAAVSDRKILVKGMDGSAWQELAGTAGATQPLIFSHDSRLIAFASGNSIKKVDLVGSRPQSLCDRCIQPGSLVMLNWTKALGRDGR